MEVQSKARLVETPPSAERGVTATLSRSEIEETLKSADGPALVVLDIARRGDEGDVEAHTLEVELDRPDLEEILRTSTGDAIELQFDGTELEQALDGDVDAHGLRQKALILSVAAATAAGVAGQASAMPVVEGGGATSALTAAPISDVVSGGPAAAQAAGAQFASDVVSGGPAGAQAAETQFASDVVSGGPAPVESQAVSDVVSGGPAGAQAAETQFASDVVSGGPAPVESQAVSDVVSGGPAPQAAETQFASDVVSGGPAASAPATTELASGGGSGINISSSDAEAAALAGGLALLITGAGITAVRRQRPPTPA
jgi:hypothetical protein